MLSPTPTPAATPAFDLSKVNVSTNGMVQTGANSFVSKDSINADGYAQAVNYQANKDAPAPAGSSTPPSVIQTTTGQRDQTAQRSADLNTKVGNASTMSSNGLTVVPIYNSQTGETSTAAPNSSLGPNWSYTAPSGGNGGQNGNQNGSDGAGNGSGSSTTDDSADTDYFAGITSAIGDAKSAASSQISTVTSNLDAARAYLDASTQNMITGLQGMYQGRIQSVEDAYNRLGKSEAESGFRDGLTRYASGQEEGILTNTEVEGNMKVAQLQAQMMDAIGKAQSAQSKGDTDIFNSEYDKIDAINKEMNTTISDLYKQAVDKQNADLKAKQDSFSDTMQQTSAGLKISAQAAPYLASKLDSLSTDEEKADFISNFATAYGIDPNVVLGDVTKALSDNQKNDLNTENIQSEIANRGKKAGTGSSGSGSASSKNDSLSMSADLAQKFEAAGLGTEDIVSLKQSLANGNNIDTILKNSKLSDVQKSLIKASVVKGTGSATSTDDTDDGSGPFD